MGPDSDHVVCEQREQTVLDSVALDKSAGLGAQVIAVPCPGLKEKPGMDGRDVFAFDSELRP